MSKISIREAVETDLPNILYLHRAAGIDDGESFSFDEALTHLRQFSKYPYLCVFVALLNNEIAGTYQLFILHTLAKRGRSSGLVEAVAVDPAHQGQGIGRAMMRHAMEQCRRARCYKLALSSNLKRESAHGFYEALGFEKHGYSFQVALPEQEMQPSTGNDLGESSGITCS